MNRDALPEVEYERGLAQAVFDRQRAARLARPFLSYRERLDALGAIESLLIAHQNDIADAVCRDFGQRSRQETLLLDVFPTVSGLSHARRHLKKWMRPRHRPTSLLFAGARNRVIPQPKGVVGIISPWNYPLQLAFSPLTSALAAGNRCMVKMATKAQRLCRLMAELVEAVLPRELVAILPGVPATEFTALPFDHLIFTGSPASGQAVMRAAADHLTPVTLELGGKSPAVVAGDVDLALAADRILYAKLINAGQTCVAPDYLFLPEGREDAFVAEARRLVTARYPRIESDDYTAIIDQRAYRRLMETLEDAGAKGARIVCLGAQAEPVADLRKIPPTLVLNVTDEMRIMQEEIFGPLLPIRTYRSLNDVIADINARPHPLALYLFTNDRTVRRRVIEQTLSGGVGINDCAVHVAQHDLPFGGVGRSGMGQYHAYEGFLEFSKLRPVFTQAPRTAVAFMYPPYGRTFQRVFTWLMRLRHL
ncbi:MAG: coniferyl aldehyde dehydrogenase [Desulfobacterales bacterium]|jgi:coniferyl-aldehyde dehydrogenase|nr:coniferyl aldehyde dehydrogenase [Desulfobacteraceae bacterium]MDD3990699.1 coniferyl aldehyde dehydrogenase [Desulfobacteraceae bacterium]MDY0311073.1 coniferyl aldehyde dehydrogenase [Desulfobacterales bacterium]